jgi:D-alanyl-D-alanine carboxypeptidase
MKTDMRRTMALVAAALALYSCSGHSGERVPSNIPSMPTIADSTYYDNPVACADLGGGDPLGGPFDQVLSDAVSKGMPGAAMLVRTGAEGARASARGYIDLKNRILMKKDSRSRIASVTKMFTAVVILQLAQEGALSLDDPIKARLPAETIRGIENADSATIRQLLNHSSGIASYTDRIDARVEERLKAKGNEDQTSARALDSVRGLPATFKPGKGCYYCNTGYLLLGLVAERATGRRMQDLYSERIFSPLGMKSSYFDPENPVHRGIARGYVEYEGSLVDTTDTDGACRTPDGGIVSTVHDLATFIEGLFGGRLLDAKAFEGMISDTLVEKRFGIGSYGLGIFKVVLWNGQVMYGHSGGEYGYGAELWYIPARKTTFALLANGSKFWGRSREAFNALVPRTWALLMLDEPGKISAKRLGPSLAASIRESIPSYEAQAALKKELDDYLKAEGLVPDAPAYTLYHGLSGGRPDVEVAQPVEKAGMDTGRIKFARTGPLEVAAMVVEGPPDRTSPSYERLRAWMREKGYESDGPNREYYYRGAWNEADPRYWLTEIQIPVKRRPRTPRRRNRGLRARCSYGAQPSRRLSATEPKA